MGDATPNKHVPVGWRDLQVFAMLVSDKLPTE